MGIREAVIELRNLLTPLYGDNESNTIAELVAEHITGLSTSQRISSKDRMLTSVQQDQLQTVSTELLTHRPVQYVLGEAWFMGLKFLVNEHVLIPRPETEELVDLIIKFSKNKQSKILDIGTGSGCIPVALEKKLPRCEIHAIDISENALRVANENAQLNNAKVDFRKVDILDESQWTLLPSFDIIVSNPPYIPLSDKSSISNNVVNFEPHIALFVADNDPLIFYKKIEAFAESRSTERIYFEIHQHYGQQLVDYFATTMFYKTSLKKDINGHDRFLLLER